MPSELTNQTIEGLSKLQELYEKDSKLWLKLEIQKRSVMFIYELTEIIKSDDLLSIEPKIISHINEMKSIRLKFITKSFPSGSFNQPNNNDKRK